jgi:hypothetical protein
MMRTLQIVLVGVTLLIAGAAYADRTFDLEGTVTIKALGDSETSNVSGTLILVDDGTYTLDAGGDVSSGIWLEEGKKLQLFQEDPSISEFIAEFEEEVSNGAGMEISVTSIVGKEKITLQKTGDITLKAKSRMTLRPGPKEGKPVKVKLSEKLVGLLQ